jgi:hypothetical protein
LETTQLWLRGVTVAEAPAIQKNFADYEIIAPLAGSVPWPFPPDGARDSVNSIMPAQGLGRAPGIKKPGPCGPGWVLPPYSAETTARRA